VKNELLRAALICGLLLPVAARVPQAAAQSHRSKVTIARFDSKPVIDGDLSDPCWQKARKLSGFFTVATVGGMIITESLAAVQTVAYLGFDDDNLYIAFECLEPEPGQVKAGQERENINDDDHVEVFLQPDTSVREYDHLGVNPKGTVLDHRITVDGGIYDYSWNCAWSVKTKVFKDRWVAEMAVPFSDINHAEPQMGQAWGLLLCRKRRVGGKEISNWPLLEGLGWHCPHQWARMKGIVIGGTTKGVRVLGCDAGTSRVGRNELKLELVNELTVDKELKARVEVTSPGKVVRSSSVDLGAFAKGKAKALPLPFEVSPEEGRHAVEVVIEDSEGKLLCEAPPIRIDIPAFVTGFLDRSYYTHEKSVEAHIFLDKLDPAIRKTCRVRGRIIADGKQVWGGPVVAPSGEKALLRAELAGIPIGTHTFEAILETGEGRKLSTVAMELRKLKPLATGTETKILIREGGDSIVLLNGKPFFPIGLFVQSPQFCESIFAEAADAGFTHVIHWGGHRTIAELKRQLDIAEKAGIYVVGASRLLTKKHLIGGFKLSREALRKGLVEKAFPVLSETIPQIAGHPKLIAWRTMDEVPARHVPAAVLLADKIRELDPYHNIYFSTEGGTDLPIARRGGEVFTHDCFIKGGDPMSGSFYKAQRLKGQCARNNRVPSSSAQVDHSAERRPLRYEEQRCHSFLALIAGAKGLEWFGDRPCWLGQWRDLQKIVGQIRRISPVLLEPDIEQDMKIDQQSPSIYARLCMKGKDYYLLAANSKIDPISATFKIQGLEAGTRVKEFYEGNKVRSGEDGSLNLTFGPYEVVVYSMRLKR